jgi:hypothetical protein
MTFINLLSTQADPMYKLLQYLFTGIKFMVPAVILVLSVVDFSKALVAQKPEDMSKAKNNLIKRLIIGVLIFFLPTIINIILGYANITNNYGVS